jgi:hypothetical protein
LSCKELKKLWLEFTSSSTFMSFIFTVELETGAPVNKPFVVISSHGITSITG